jgi:hypothetical protein
VGPRSAKNLDPALDEEFFDIAVGKAEAQVPADRQHNDIGWVAEADEDGARSH